MPKRLVRDRRRLAAPGIRAVRLVRSTGGFTLLEIMIVVLVIALLAALILARFTDAKDAAYRDAILNDLRNYALTQELHRSLHGHYASGPAALENFRYSPDVIEDSVAAEGGGWFLRLGHRKSRTVCSMAVGSFASADTLDGRILCGKGNVEDDEEQEDEPDPDPPPVENQAPIAAFEWSPLAPRAGEEVHFRQMAMDPDDDELSYFWRFSNLGTSTDPNPTFTFPKPNRTLSP